MSQTSSERLCSIGHRELVFCIPPAPQAILFEASARRRLASATGASSRNFSAEKYPCSGERLPIKNFATLFPRLLVLIHPRPERTVLFVISLAKTSLCRSFHQISALFLVIITICHMML